MYNTYNISVTYITQVQRYRYSCLVLQTPGPPFLPDEVGVKVKARITFVQHGATLSSEDNLLMGLRDEALSTLGEMQANKAAELLMDLKVITTSPPAAQFSLSVFLPKGFHSFIKRNYH